MLILIVTKKDGGVEGKSAVKHRLLQTQLIVRDELRLKRGRNVKVGLSSEEASALKAFSVGSPYHGVVVYMPLKRGARCKL